MIGFFPEPHPDELLFSIVSRYAEQTDYHSTEGLARELFGGPRLQLPVALPSNLGALITRLPPGHHFSVNRLINDHTLLPLFAPFISTQRYDLVHRDMSTNKAALAYGRLGVNRFKGVLRFFRYCPACVESDRKEFGETYWHRVHHIPGIEICATHYIYLIECGVSVRSVNRRRVFVTAEAALENMDSAFDYEKNARLLEIQKELAANAFWLLKHPVLTGYSQSYRNYYVRLLFERGFSTYSGIVRRQKLAKEVISYYSSDLLARLNCDTISEAGDEDWLNRFVHRRPRAIHPIHHLLMLQFLGGSLKALLKTASAKTAGENEFLELKPFGRKPWPCLNATADHFGQDVVLICEIVSAQRAPRPPRGKFRCSCGFAYSRIGPDKSTADRHVLDRYISFGEVWDNAVKEMVAKKWTLKQIARAVKVSPRTVAEQLARLGLQTRGRKTPYPVVERPDGRKRRHQNTKRLRELHRGKFLAIREGNPQLSRNKIAQKYAATYSWLYQNDLQWLLERLPAKVCPSDRPPRQSKWLLKDAELAAAVVVEAARIRALDGRPEMISETAIASNLEILHVWSKRRRVLPLTTKALHAVAETWDDFTVRRVEWAAASFAEQGLSPGRWRIVERAGITSKVAKTPVIAAALDRAIAFLTSQMELDYSKADAA